LVLEVEVSLVMVLTGCVVFHNEKLDDVGLVGGGVVEESCPLVILPVEVVAGIGVDGGPFTLFTEILGLLSDEVVVVDVDEVVCVVLDWEARVVGEELALAGFDWLEVEVEVEAEADVDSKVEVVDSSMPIDVFISWAETATEDNEVWDPSSIDEEEDMSRVNAVENGIDTLRERLTSPTGGVTVALDNRWSEA
jgi:hypothetical protein